jgi:hypothetical protein
MTESDEFSKDLAATQTRNLKPVTITLTAIEVFAVVSAIQFAKSVIPDCSSLGNCATEAARKMHNCMDSNSLLYQQLNEGWDGETSNNLETSKFSPGNYFTEDFPPESLPPESFSL